MGTLSHGTHPKCVCCVVSSEVARKADWRLVYHQTTLRYTIARREEAARTFH